MTDANSLDVARVSAEGSYSLQAVKTARSGNPQFNRADRNDEASTATVLST